MSITHVTTQDETKIEKVVEDAQTLQYLLTLISPEDLQSDPDSSLLSISKIDPLNGHLVTFYLDYPDSDSASEIDSDSDSASEIDSESASELISDSNETL